MTLIERLAGIQADLLAPDVIPETARKHLITLTAMWGDFKRDATEADIAYRAARWACRKSQKSAADATLAAEATDEYAGMRRATANEEFVLELIRTCKAAMKSIDEEMRLTR